MAKMNPVTYAEQELGVHVPWGEAQERLASHREAIDSTTHFKDLLRTEKDKLEDKKREARADAVTEIDFYDSMSVKEREQAVRDYLANHADIAVIEANIRQAQSDLDAAEADTRHHELGLKVLSSRMTELGGLLHFFAEVKRAETEKLLQVVQADGSISPTRETGEVS